MANHLFDALLPAGRGRNSTCLIRQDGRRVSYGEVDRLSARFASALASWGVRRGDRVAVQVEKSAEALFLYLACLRAGAIYLPLNTAYTPVEIDYFMRDAQPSVFIGRPQHADVLEAIARRRNVRRFETLDADGSGSVTSAAAGAGGAWGDVECAPQDVATILYTSGTTGRSKGAMLSHSNLCANAAALADAWRYTADDVLIHALPLFHAHGLFVGTNVTLMAGASMILLPKFEPAEVLRFMPDATVMMGVPTFYTRLLAEPALDEHATAGMRLFVSGSAPLLAETHAAFRHRTGHAILERYGMTETSMNTSNPYDGERVPGSVGFPLPGVEVRIVDAESGCELETDAVGMIEVRGPNVFSGYWRMPEKTRTEFRDDGFFITGDLGRIDRRGYVWIMGRGKDLVISGGFNVYPKEVELAIDALAGVAESAVIGVPHADFGEAVTAIVVPEAGAALDAAEIIAALREELAAYKLPKRVILVGELPRNTMGKVQKNRLREQYAALFHPSGSK